MDGKCPGCSAEVNSEISLTCDGCNRPMLYTCLALPADMATSADRARRMSSHIKILCADCDEYFKTFSAHSASVVDAILERCFEKFRGEFQGVFDEIKSVRAEVNNLKDSNIDLVKLLTSGKNLSTSPVKLSTVENNIPASYASTLTSDKKIVVKPKNAAQSVTQTRSDVLKNVNFIDEKIAITHVKQVSSGGLIISCQDESDGKKFKEIAAVNLAENYKIKEVEPLRPSVRVVGMSKDISKELIVTYLKKQNPDLFNQSFVYKLIRFWPTHSNKEIYQADIEVDIRTYNLLLKSGHVLVGLNPCTVYDAVTVPRCYRCNGFFHSSRQCKNELSCPMCAEKHKINECPISRETSDISEKVRCINCKNMRSRPENICENHAAWEYNKCTSYKIALDKFKQDLFSNVQINNPFLH